MGLHKRFSKAGVENGANVHRKRLKKINSKLTVYQFMITGLNGCT